MFDLNEQLDAWKQSFDNVEALRGGDVNELEQQVRDSVAELSAKGLTGEEAFAIAIRRVGDPRPLAAPFLKANGNRVWAQRVFLMIVGFLSLQMVYMLIWVSQLLVVYTGAPRDLLLGTSIAIPVVCWGLVAMILYRSAGNEGGGLLARLCGTRRWVILSLVLIIPMAVTLAMVGSGKYLTSASTQEGLTEVSKFQYWSQPWALVVIFILLIATADSLRHTAAKGA
jgi:hypothetical protein